MSDRYASSYYEQLHPAQAQAHAQAQAAMSHYATPSYRSGYSGYNTYGYGYGGSAASAAYMPNYYRYAPYASPHYSQPAHHQHPGMFTPAGQQLIPSSVLHYPPRSHTHTHNGYPQQQPSSSSYEQPAPAPYSTSPYSQSRGFAAYQSNFAHYVPPGRSSTPAPNRTVLPPSYLEPTRNYAEQQQQLSQVAPKLEDSLPEQLKLEPETEAASPAQRLTTSPPLISATGTDSGISNCSTRARSDSSQSTPVYSGEYPVNMSVESASCVSYHCPADGRDFEEEQQQQQQQLQQQQHQQQQPQQQSQQPEAEENKPTAVFGSLDVPDDISATAATSASPLTPADMASDIDKAATEKANEEQSEVVRRAKINLAKPNKEPTPQDTAEQQQQLATNQINEDAEAERGQQQPPPKAAAAAAPAHNWSPTPRRPRTPPAPQNSPVGYCPTVSALAPSVPPALAPLLQQQQQPNISRRHAAARNRNSNCSSNNHSSSNLSSSNNRIIECDLIPSKKSKRKSSKREADSGNVEAAESTVREQIRDIKPLPGFQQTFGSTEIGRFSERFLQTTESLVDRLAEEYGSSNNNAYGGYYEATNNGMHGYWPYEEQQQQQQYSNVGYHPNYQMSRSRMRNQNYPYPDYAAYERYGYGAYNTGRSRYNEIRCNGY